MRPAILGAISGGGSAALDTDVQSWLTRVASASGTVSAGTQTAVNTFVLACKAASIWTLFRRLNLCVGDFNASFVPLVNTSGGTTDTNVNLVSGDYAENLGWRTDGSTKYISTGYTPSEATGGLAVYLRTEQTGTRVPIGCRDAGSTQTFRIASISTVPSAVWGQGSAVASGGAAGLGFLHSSRRSATDLVLYRNGASVGSSNVSTTPATPGVPMTVLAQNAGGPITLYLAANSYVGGYAVDSGMSPTQAANYATIWQAFQTAMGRAV